MAQTALGARSQVTEEAAAPTGRLIDVCEAAQMMGTPVRFVRRLISERRIQFYKVGKYVRLDTVDVDRFIQAGRIEPDA